MSTTKDAPNLQMDFVEIVAPRLWMSTTYKNDYVGNAKPSAALDVDNPLPGWYDLGSISAVTVPLTKEVFESKKGQPKTARKIWEIDRTAQIVFSTSDLSPYVEALMTGRTIYNSVTATPFVVASLLTAQHRTYAQIDIGAGIAQNTLLVANDLVVCASPTVASLEKSYNLAMVDSISAVNATESQMTLSDSGFPLDMVLEDQIRKVKAVEFIDRMGVDVTRSIMLFWDTFVDADGNIKVQHVLYYPKVRNFSGSDTDLKDAAEAYDMSLTLTAQAVNMTFGDGTTGYDFYKKWVLTY
jgi:hypothetical protein